MIDGVMDGVTPIATRGSLRRGSVRPSAAGFTLLEVLAVVVIVTLATSIVSVNLSSVGSSGALRQAAAELRAFDARARLFARTTGPVRLVLDRDRRTLELRLVASGELLRRTRLSHEVQAKLVSDRTVYEVRFDREGASPDYDVVLTAGNRRRQWSQLGLTGWSLEDAP